MKIENITLDDIKEINKIRNYYISNTNYIFRRCEKSYDNDLDFFKECLANNYPCVVAKDGNEITGFAYLYPFRSLDGYDKTMELSIYTSPNKKQKGIGSALLKEIEALSKDKYHTLVSVITADNQNSIAFHKKTGFTEIGTMKECGYVNGTFLDATFMQKILYKA